MRNISPADEAKVRANILRNYWKLYKHYQGLAVIAHKQGKAACAVHFQQMADTHQDDHFIELEHSLDLLSRVAR